MAANALCGCSSLQIPWNAAEPRIARPRLCCSAASPSANVAATVGNKGRILVDGQGNGSCTVEATIYSGRLPLRSEDEVATLEAEPLEASPTKSITKKKPFASIFRAKALEVLATGTSQLKTKVMQVLDKDRRAVAAGVKWTRETAFPLITDGLFLMSFEDSTASPRMPNWQTPSYRELRGWDMLSADIATVKQFYDNVLLQFAIWQLPLQDEYQPDRLNNYFGSRPHLVLFRAVEVSAAFSYLLLWFLFESHVKTLTRTSRLSEEEDAERRVRTAEMFKGVMMNLGPTFVKVAQSLSTRSDLIGPDTARVLSSMQDRLPPFPNEEAVRVVEQELGCSVSDAFSYFSAEPVAAASLGQVYKGRTIDGQDVAIKVQRPNILFSIARDVYILRLGLGLVRKVAKINTNLAIFADEIGRGLFGELDYRQEAANARDFQSALSKLPFVVVPNALPHLTTRKVLTMEWISGTRPVDLRAEATGEFSTGPEAQEFAKRRLLHMVNKGVQASLTQLLDVGILHADPHPGNIIYTANNSIGYLDFGLICRLKRKHQYAMIAATAHMVNGEWGYFVDDLEEMDVLKPATDRFRLQLALGDALSDAVVKEGIPDFKFSQMLGKLLKVALKFRFQLPPYFMLILRSIASLEGMALSVDPNFKVFSKTYPFVIRRLLSDKSSEMRRILQTLLLSSKREFRWDRVASFMTLSSQLEEQGNAESSETLESTLWRLILTSDGKSLRRILLEADTRSLALAFTSKDAAPARMKLAKIMTDAFYSHGRDALLKHTEVSLRPRKRSPTADKTQNSKHLRFLLQAFWTRLPLLLLPQVAWACICVLSRAGAAAFHELAVDAAYGDDCSSLELAALGS